MILAVFEVVGKNKVCGYGKAGAAVAAPALAGLSFYTITGLSSILNVAFADYGLGYNRVKIH